MIGTAVRAHRFLGRLIAAAIVAVLSLFPAQAQPDAPTAIGMVVGRSGIVTVLRAATPGMLMPGDQIHLGDRILTGPGARLRIAFGDGSTVAVGPRTDVALSRFVLAPDGAVTEGSVDLARGILRTSLAPSSVRERFEIRTHAAAAFAHSTDWIVEATDAGVAVFVVSGRVVVVAVGSDETVTLDPDFGMDLTVGAAPGAPERWAKERVVRALNLTGSR